MEERWNTRRMEEDAPGIRATLGGSCVWWRGTGRVSDIDLRRWRKLFNQTSLIHLSRLVDGA